MAVREMLQQYVPFSATTLDVDITNSSDDYLFSCRLLVSSLWLFGLFLQSYWCSTTSR